MRYLSYGLLRTATSARRRPFVALILAMACVVCRAEEATNPPQQSVARQGGFATFAPRGVFAQFGVGDDVAAGTVGVMWSLYGDPIVSRWGVYAEASLSRWNSHGGRPSETGVLAQFAAIPVLRYRFANGDSPCFAEGGVGATITSSVYRSGQKHFSTAFNFGDHVGLGYGFGQTKSNELVLRLQHFSNAGIKEPNPGQNFVQLRYAHHFD